MRIDRTHFLDVDAFEALDKALAPGMRVAAEVHAAGHGPVLCRPALLLGDKPEELVRLIFQTRHQPPAWSGLLHVEDALVCGDNLTLVKGRPLVGTSLMYHPRAFPLPHQGVAVEPLGEGEWSLAPPGTVVEYAGVTASLVCAGWQIYGHWLVDVLPRLHRLQRCGAAVDRYLLPGPMSAWQLELLDLLGVDRGRIACVDLSAAAVRCERLVLPTFDRFNSALLPDAVQVYRALVERAVARHGERRGAPGARLFISRGHLGRSRELVNRPEIEAAFAEAGFQVTAPETMSVAEQIALMDSAAVVAGECGSGLHNAAFCRRGTRVGVIQDALNRNLLQGHIGALLGHDVFYLAGAGTDPSGLGPFRVDVHGARRLAHTIAAA